MINRYCMIEEDQGCEPVIKEDGEWIKVDEFIIIKRDCVIAIETEANGKMINSEEAKGMDKAIEIMRYYFKNKK